MNRTVLIGVSAIVFVLLCVCLPVAGFATYAVTQNGQFVGRSSTSTPTRTPTPARSNETATPARSASTATPARSGSTATPARSGSTATPSRPGTTATPARSGSTPTPARPSAADPLNATVIGDSFLRSLRDFNDAEAFALFHPGLQEKYDGADEFGDLVTDNNVRPDKWERWAVSADSDGGEPTTVVKTDVIFQDGLPGKVELEVIGVRGTPKIIRFSMTH